MAIPTATDARDAIDPAAPLPPEASGASKPTPRATRVDGHAIDPRHVGLGLTMRTLGEGGMWLMLAALVIISDTRHASTLNSVLILSGLVRGLAHAFAGRRLMRGGACGLRWQWLYRGAALAQTAVVLPTMSVMSDAGVGDLLLVGLLLLAWPVASALALRGHTGDPVAANAHGWVERGVGVVGAMMWIAGVPGLVLGLGLGVAGVLLGGTPGALAVALGGALALRAAVGLAAARHADLGGHSAMFIAGLRRYGIAAAVSLAVLVVAVFLVVGLDRLGQGARVRIWALLTIALGLGSVWPRALFAYARRHLAEGVAVALPRRDPVGVGAVLVALGAPLVVFATSIVIDAVGPGGELDAATVQSLVVAALTLVAGVCLWRRVGRPVVTGCALVVGGLALWSGVQTISELAGTLDLAGPHGLPLGLVAQPLVAVIVQVGLLIAVPLGVLRLVRRDAVAGWRDLP